MYARIQIQNCKVLRFQFHLNCVYVFIILVFNLMVAFRPKLVVENNDNRILFFVFTGIVVILLVQKHNNYLKS
jgi:hypothetical protein